MKLAIFAVLGILFIAGCYHSVGGTDSGPVSTEGNVIEITSSGFSPSNLEISAGEKVTFINKDSKAVWPASNIHPTHTVYPETGGCIGSTFDACKGLSQEESYSFTFNQAGTWNYHDHLRPSIGGTITVQ